MMQLRKVQKVLAVGLALAALGLGPARADVTFGGQDQPIPNNIGTNLGGIADWSTEFPFVDLMKSARPWVSVSSTTWDDGRPLATDSDGWVTSLLEDQGATTVFLTSMTKFPEGTYTLRWEGQGTIELSRPLTPVSAGVATFDVARPDGFTILTISAVDEADPIRNIEILPPGGICAGRPERWAQSETDCRAGRYRSFVDHVDDIVFTPWFLRVVSNYGTLRFMDWMNTNNNPSEVWADRPLVSDATYMVDGVPVEVLIDLSNRLDADPWFTLPHLADDNYVRQFAEMVEADLDPSLVARVEYSNEVWNGIFEQYAYAAEQGLAAGLAEVEWEAAWRWYAERSTEVHKIWIDAFAERSRLRLVTSTQSASAGVSSVILGQGDTAEWTDELAVAPYFGDVPTSDDATVEILATPLDDYFTRINTTLLDDAFAAIPDQLALADQYDLDLVAYEGGQHFVGAFGQENNDELTEYFHVVNRDPRIRDTYITYLNRWRELTDNALMAHFTDAGAYSKWGRWGAMESVFDTRAQSPKWDAILTLLADDEGGNGGGAGLRCAGRRATLVGTAGDDVLVGTRSRDVIVAGRGNDTIRGLGGGDVICGGAGADTMLGGNGRDVCRGGRGRDTARRCEVTRSVP
jgi:hypothetical protein